MDLRDSRSNEQRKLHNKQVRNLCSTTQILRVDDSRTITWTRLVVRMGETSNAHRILLGKRTNRWQDNIKINLRLYYI